MLSYKFALITAFPMDVRINMRHAPLAPSFSLLNCNLFTPRSAHGSEASFFTYSFTFCFSMSTNSLSSSPVASAVDGDGGRSGSSSFSSSFACCAAAPPAGNFGNAVDPPPPPNAVVEGANGLFDALFAPPTGGNKDGAPPLPPPAANGFDFAPIPNAVGFGKSPKRDVFGCPSSSESESSSSLLLLLLLLFFSLASPCSPP
mmetsp:Transcript_7838/g.24608  ORF Transcript_7838/g.24608 Transcript_7838/m.24608 type:complete len:202 (-) Transcript_7838:343-948(-)